MVERTLPVGVTAEGLYNTEPMEVSKRGVTCGLGARQFAL